MLFDAMRNIGITICLVLLSTDFYVSAQVSGPVHSSVDQGAKKLERVQINAQDIISFFAEPSLIYDIPTLYGMIAMVQKADEKSTVEKLGDHEVIAMLSNRNTESAHMAVEEIMRRGDRMIPLLVRCKGNKSFFWGYGLGHHLSSFIIRSPVKDTDINDGSLITVEVAALYLISSIYHKTTEFAQAPYLSDGKPVDRQRFNTPERVRQAWESTEKWIEAFTSEGLEPLRSKGLSPLSRSKVRFWGGG